MNIVQMSLTALKKELDEGRLTSVEIVQAFKKEYEKDLTEDLPLHGFIEFFDDAEKLAQHADALRSSGVNKPLLGLPFAVKDNISIRGKACTCCSNILKGYIAPFNATVIERMLDAGAIPLGRTNMDEFAMGSSTEYSAYGPSRNPFDRTRTPGGSSGGSAAVVAGNQAPFALGTETGGSVRLPASYCGLYGLKPTYGTISRFGVVAFGSSLDQVGLFAHTADDIALVLSVVAGTDSHDATSANLLTDSTTAQHFARLTSLTAYSKDELRTLKLAIPREFRFAQGLSAAVKEQLEGFLSFLLDHGASIDEVTIPILDASIPVYYVLAVSEATSNLARFDGIRYGLRKDAGNGYDELYTLTRSEGFGSEVKRRIMAGNYVLSKHFSGDCYEKALSVRAIMEQRCAELFNTYDFIIAPTAATSAFKLGEKVDDPLAMYASDLFTTFVNLAHLPALSVPVGYEQKGEYTLPIGMQIIGKHFSEPAILRLAKTWQEA